MDSYKVYSSKTSGLFTGLIEVWKDVDGFEGHYQVSSFGRVKSLARYRPSARGGFAFIKERIMKLKTTKYGYKTVHLRRDDISIHPSVHRLVASAFISNPESKPTVNHIDANKENNNASNLEWSSHSEQMNHAVKNELLEVRGSPKYSKEFKKQIYDYYVDNNISIQKLSVLFGVSNRTAGRIVNEGVKPRTTTRVLKTGTVIIEDILTKEQVEEIKVLRQQGWTFKQLGEKFNRGLSQMHRIVNNLSRTTEIE